MGDMTFPILLVVLPGNNVSIVVGAAGREQLPVEFSPSLNRIVKARLSRVDVPITVTTYNGRT
jgi:hypothetical protein